jgi:hypothetical protein
MQNLRQSEGDHEILYANRPSKDDQFLTRLFKKNNKYECGGRLKFKTHILFYGDNKRTFTLAVRQIQFGKLKDYGHTYKS